MTKTMKGNDEFVMEIAGHRFGADVQVGVLNLNAAARLKAAVIRAGGPKKVATRAGVSISTLNAAMTARNEPKIGFIAHVAAVIGVSLDYLMYGEPEPTGLPSVQNTVPQPLRGNVAEVPYYNVRASAGPGSVPLDEHPSAMLEFDHRVMRMLGVSPANAALLAVDGDSGMPTIGDGDAILIDRSMRHLRDGGLYVIGIDEDVVVKRVERQADRSVLLKSDNPSYSTQHVPAAEAERLRVIGRVRWAFREVS